jgi:hypothetical protein
MGGGDDGDGVRFSDGNELWWWHGEVKGGVEGGESLKV